MSRKIDYSTTPTIEIHGRIYFCLKCKGLFDENRVPIGKIIKMPDGYSTYLCEKCVKEEEIEED